MKKVGFVEIYTKVEGKQRVMKLLETPTLLLRLLKLGDIDQEEYDEKVTIYNEAIERKKHTVKRSA